MVHSAYSGCNGRPPLFHRDIAEKRKFSHLPVEQEFLKGLFYASVSEKQ